MKRWLQIAPLIATLAGCMADPRSHDSENYSAVPTGGRAVLQTPPPTHIVWSIRADGEHIYGRRIFQIGKQRFTALQEFKAFIQSLPPGSIVAWNTGCILYETIPLLHSDMTIHTFKDYCQDYGVEFRYICGGF
ncbi:MAG: hypothetical protein IT579_12205 [Verrucomicrobia subdivision 3 bacterium]|nr:hypothetical protein [Limisphaerales bacterium]